MNKKTYSNPQVKVISIKFNCMLGNQSGEGTGDSLDVKFEEEDATTKGE